MIKNEEYSNYKKSSLDPNEKQKQIDTNSLNQLLSVIYDDEFVIMINDLSHTIKIYNKAMIQFFNQMKLILSKNYSFLDSLEDQKDANLPTIPTLFNSLETNYKTFFNSAKVIFKKMKKYRNEKLESINKLPLGEKNLKFCFINFSKTNSSTGITIKNQTKSCERKPDNLTVYSKSSSNKEKKINFNDRKSYNLSINTNNNITNSDSNKLLEENIELKNKILFLEKKIEFIGNNKKNIIPNNINNISNFHLQENINHTDIDIVRENKNIIKTVKNLINILEYEQSPDYSCNKNTFDNVEEIAEHKKEITNQKDELIFTIKNYLYDIEINRRTKTENTDMNNLNLNNEKSKMSLRQIDELKKVIEMLEIKIKKISEEKQNYIEEINNLEKKNKEIIDENKKKEEHEKKKGQILQNQMVSLVNQIVELKQQISNKETQYNDLKQSKEKNINNLKNEIIELKTQIKDLSSEKIVSEEKMLKLIQQKNKEISSLINERNEIKKEKLQILEKK